MSHPPEDELAHAIRARDAALAREKELKQIMQHAAELITLGHVDAAHILLLKAIIG